MSKVVITIEDLEDGKMSINVEFEPVASEEFASHRAAAIALATLSKRLGFDLDDAVTTSAEAE